MTTPPKRSLLEDFVDGELTDEEACDFQRRLQNTPELQNEHEMTVRLKELLKHQPVPDPGDEYWSEATSLILARITGAGDSHRETVSVPELLARRRTAFMRSAVSAAASLFILFSALVIGSNRTARKDDNFGAGGRMLVTTNLADRLAQPMNDFTFEAEKADLAVGNLLLGPPGHVGRFHDVSEMLPMR